MVRYGEGDLVEARALVSEALRLCEDAGSSRTAADARAALAEIEFASGHAEEALRLNAITTQFFRSQSNLIGLPLPLSNSSAYLIALERFQEARELAVEALQRSYAIGSVHSAFWVMQHLAALAVFAGNARDDNTLLPRAASVLGFVDEATMQRGIPRYLTELQEYDKVLAAVREALGKVEVAKFMDAGKHWSEERAFAEALAL